MQLAKVLAAMRTHAYCFLFSIQARFKLFALGDTASIGVSESPAGKLPGVST